MKQTLVLTEKDKQAIVKGAQRIAQYYNIDQHQYNCQCAGCMWFWYAVYYGKEVTA